MYMVRTYKNHCHEKDVFFQLSIYLGRLVRGTYICKRVPRSPGSADLHIAAANRMLKLLNHHMEVKSPTALRLYLRCVHRIITEQLALRVINEGKAGIHHQTSMPPLAHNRQDMLKCMRRNHCLVRLASMRN